MPKNNIAAAPAARVPEAEQPYPVPDNWAWMTLGSISSINMGQSPEGTSVNDDSSGIPLIGGPSDMGEIYPVISRYTTMPTKLSASGDLILSVRATLGKINISDANYCLGRGVAGITPIHVELHFLRYYFATLTHYLYEIGKGSTFSQVSKNDLNHIGIPVPPLAEQRRIVATLDSLLGKLRAARDLLDAARDSFALRRAAILHKAFSGQLTAAWRKEHPDIEQAEHLFQHIIEEKKKLRTSKKFLFEYPIPYEIPTTWKWVTFGSILNVSSGDGLTKAEIAEDGKIPVYGGNGIIGHHNMSNVSEHNIIIGRVGYYCGSVHLTEEEAWITDNALIVDFSRKYIHVKYLFWLLTYSNLGQTSNSSAQPVVSGKTLYPMPLQLAPIDEQREIVRRLDALLTHEAEAAALLDMDEHLDLLEQSILARAFRGELGTRDPADAPALAVQA